MRVWTRRHIVIASATVVVAPIAVTRPALSAVGPDVDPSMKPPSALFLAARAELANGREIVRNRVKLDLPRLAENGNSVTLKIDVDSPMTAADYVKFIHILSEQNPIATVARFHLALRAGRAFVSTSIRLATTQNVHAIAEMSDGTLWFDAAESVVLLAACIDGG